MNILIYSLFFFKKYENIIMFKINKKNNNFSIMKNNISYIGGIDNIVFFYNNILIKIKFLNAVFFNKNNIIKVICNNFYLI